MVIKLFDVYLDFYLENYDFFNSPQVSFLIISDDDNIQLIDEYLNNKISDLYHKNEKYCLSKDKQIYGKPKDKQDAIRMFELLLSVSGIGAKVALTILSNKVETKEIILSNIKINNTNHLNIEYNQEDINKLISIEEKLSKSTIKPTLVCPLEKALSQKAVIKHVAIPSLRY